MKSNELTIIGVDTGVVAQLVVDDFHAIAVWRKTAERLNKSYDLIFYDEGDIRAGFEKCLNR